EYKEWYRNGQLKIWGAFQNGLYSGKWVWWSGYGTKTGEAEYKNGDGVQVSWYPNGKKQREIPYKNNEKHGKAIHYDKSGEVNKIIIYDEGKVVEEKEGAIQ
ncbi:MAG: hypothetical protein K9I68_04260, partial [Bacteroidales bacterium]|nr:hypothetical protein [Bacteroidales bacterium]